MTREGGNIENRVLIRQDRIALRSNWKWRRVSVTLVAEMTQYWVNIEAFTSGSATLIFNGTWKARLFLVQYTILALLCPKQKREGQTRRACLRAGAVFHCSACLLGPFCDAYLVYDALVSFCSRAHVVFTYSAGTHGGDRKKSFHWTKEYAAAKSEMTVWL